MERELGCGFTERGLVVILKKGFGLTTTGVRGYVDIFSQVVVGG